MVMVIDRKDKAMRTNILLLLFLLLCNLFLFRLLMYMHIPLGKEVSSINKRKENIMMVNETVIIINKKIEEDICYVLSSAHNKYQLLFFLLSLSCSYCCFR